MTHTGHTSSLPWEARLRQGSSLAKEVFLRRVLMSLMIRRYGGGDRLGAAARVGEANLNLRPDLEVRRVVQERLEPRGAKRVVQRAIPVRIRRDRCRRGRPRRVERPAPAAWPESDVLFRSVHASRRGRAQPAGAGPVLRAFYGSVRAMEQQRAIGGDRRQAWRAVHDGRGDVLQGASRRSTGAT